ncbi:MAG: hypothetical protein KTR17_05080 [Cellvibrionaceae bacterium]|nr:hypothetical protein [Cellvibrionaceae bacterium]
MHPSPFQTAAALCLIGVGEWATSSVCLGEGNSLTPLWEIDFPHSLGLLCSAFTYYATDLSMVNRRFCDFFGAPACALKSDIRQKEMDIACPIQGVTEDIILKLAAKLHRETGCGRYRVAFNSRRPAQRQNLIHHECYNTVP